MCKSILITKIDLELWYLKGCCYVWMRKCCSVSKKYIWDRWINMENTTVNMNGLCLGLELWNCRDLKVMDCIEYATRMWVLNQMNELKSCCYRGYWERDYSLEQWKPQNF
jgi:hypothetical protein